MNRKANRKSQKLSPLPKMAGNLPSIFNHLKLPFCLRRPILCETLLYMFLLVFFVNISYCIYPKYSDRQTCASSAEQLLHRQEFAIHPVIFETRHQIVRWSCCNVSRSMVRR